WFPVLHDFHIDNRTQVSCSWILDPDLSVGCLKQTTKVEIVESNACVDWISVCVAHFVNLHQFIAADVFSAASSLVAYSVANIRPEASLGMTYSSIVQPATSSPSIK